ncbi:hypothetical protein BDA99DRAFT_505223 [Phascolomyces articulosus]|uniref:Uncharacterized protein n=1 Tax=Phascolomyces articulosus TaxID=60185 RepID=A0AAD5K468_9FUNG|nr:hypothetical protein BDA99DRAFT_505223 [Phascolomyces articulosus]
MALAAFPLVINRYTPSVFVTDEYESYANLAEYLPKETFEQRMETIKTIVKEKYPNIYPETYMFSIAVILVVITAAFAILGRTLDISIWYPLLILIAPAILAYGTTRRRNQHLRKFLVFQDTLNTCLKDMTSQDITRHVKWDYRRLRQGDTAQTLHLKRPLSSWTISLVVEAIQVDPETDLTRVMGEALPSYTVASQDIVLDIGTPVTDTVVQLREMDLADVTRHDPTTRRTSSPTAATVAVAANNNNNSNPNSFLPPPPDYQETTEPPAYHPEDPLPSPTTPSSPITSLDPGTTNTTITRNNINNSGYPENNSTTVPATRNS